MLGWAVKAGKATWKWLRDASATTEAGTKGAKRAAEKIVDAQLRATVAAENALARTNKTRTVMVDDRLGRGLAQTLRERGGERFRIRRGTARSPGKLVDRAGAEGCEALVIDGSRLGTARRARGRGDLILCAVAGRPATAKEQALQDADEILDGIAKAKPGTDIAHFMGQGPSIAVPARQWSLPEWAKALEPLANTVAKWTAGLGGALAAVGLGKDDLETSYPGGFTAGSSEGVQQLGHGAEPHAAGAGSEGRAGEAGRLNEKDAKGTTHDASIRGSEAPDLEARLEATRAQRYEIEEAIAARQPTEGPTEMAAAIGLSAVGVQTRGRAAANASNEHTGAQTPRNVQRSSGARRGRRRAQNDDRR